MFDRLTYKQKNYGLLAVFILLAMVSYKRSFILSINLKQEINQQDMQKQEIKHSTKKLDLLKVEIDLINKNLGRTDETTDKVQQELLKEISNFPKSYKLTVENINPTHLFATVDYRILTSEVLLEGNFKGLVKAINQLEREFEYARIINTDIFKTKDYGDKKSKVYAKILFQHYFKM